MLVLGRMLLVVFILVVGSRELYADEKIFVTFLLADLPAFGGIRLQPGMYVCVVEMKQVRLREWWQTIDSVKICTRLDMFLRASFELPISSVWFLTTERYLGVSAKTGSWHIGSVVYPLDIQGIEIYVSSWFYIDDQLQD